MSSFSEYHASQIEILTILGYENINKVNEKFHLNKTVYYKDSFMDIENYLIRPLADALTGLNKPRLFYIISNKRQYIEKYTLTERSIMYYLGKYNIAQRYAMEEPHNFFDKFLAFQNDINDLYMNLQNRNFDRIIIAKDNFMKHYLEYFVIPKQ